MNNLINSSQNPDRDLFIFFAIKNRELLPEFFDWVHRINYEDMTSEIEDPDILDLYQVDLPDNYKNIN